MKFRDAQSDFSRLGEGATRKRRKFLLWPRLIDGYWHVFVWVTVTEKVSREMNYGSLDYGYHFEWKEIEYEL